MKLAQRIGAGHLNGYHSYKKTKSQMLNYENTIRKFFICHFEPFSFDVRIERQN
jgi:hypothetical protein